MRSKFVSTLWAMIAGLALISPIYAKGDLTKQEPIEIKVELGTQAGEHSFNPNHLIFETGRLYKLVLVNQSKSKHYFTSHGLAKSVFTRKVQIIDATGTKVEVKGAISEIEVYPGAIAEWWFVPVATGEFSDLHCNIKDSNGKTHAHMGMTGTIEIK